MKVRQLHYVNENWKETSAAPSFNAKKCQLVIVFGSPECITSAAFFNHLKKEFPSANIVSASTAGEILSDNVHENSAVVTAIEFEKTTIRCTETNVKKHDNSFETGKYLIQELDGENLNAVFILSDGMNINGSELVSGFNEFNKRGIPVTGGLAGDGGKFIKTFVGLNKVPSEGNLVAVGFYGEHIQVAHGSFGGWDEFGPERKITKSNKNVLFEIDGKNALDLYKEYLGPYSDELPGSAFQFPLSIRLNGSEGGLIRTILALNEEDKSLTFAGNMPEGSKVRLMKGNFDHLIDGSGRAAELATELHKNNKPDLAILITCVGRKIVLQHRTDEEVQAAQNIFGESTKITGFYSYGEISPYKTSTQCELHNQTMTVTTFAERA